MLICIVGKSCSGKTYICELLKQYSNNIVHLDIDTISHKILTYPSVYTELQKTFGPSVWDGSSINRKALAQIVFNSETEMAKLTDITWPPMEIAIDEFISQNRNKIILLDWQLLLKTKYYELSHLKILVDSPLEIRTSKAIMRDRITKEAFLTREKAAYQFNYNDFDYVINNDYSNKVKEKVKKIYDESIISR